MTTMKDRLEVCASRLLTSHGFIGTLFSAIEREISDKVPTAGASGNRLFFNPAWCENLKDRELLFVCGHEALHVLFKHSYRRMERDPGLANIAQDAVINRLLVKDNIGDVPTDSTGQRIGVFIDWVTDEMDWETVYLRLMQNMDESKEKYGGGGFDGEGDVEPPEDSSDVAEAEADIMIHRVISAAKAAGIKSALIDRVLGEGKASRIDWRDELPATIQQGSPTDYSWLRFDRRFIQDNLYLPTRHAESVGRLVIGIDVSGSMTERILAQTGANVRRIVEDTHPSEVVVIYCGSEIYRVDTFPDGTAVELKMCGGGGTDMREIVWHVDKMEGDICACIIFTDGYTPFVAQEPDYPLIWAILGNASRFKIPAGRVVEVIA